MKQLHKRMKESLLDICEAATAVEREPALDIEDPIITKLQKLHDEWGSRISSEYQEWVYKICSIVTDKPELDGLYERFRNGKTSRVVQPFTVIVFGRNETGHDQDAGAAVIVTHGKNRYYVDKGGRTGWTYDWKRDQCRIATPEEVKKCIEDLTPIQLMGMMAQSVFEPVFAHLFEDEDETTEAQPTPPEAVSAL